MCVFECFLVVPLQTLTRAMALVVLFTARSQCRPSSVSHECGKGRKPGSKLAFSEDSRGLRGKCLCLSSQDLGFLPGHVAGTQEVLCS